MNIDIAEIENLISMYIELDEKGKKDIIQNTARLWASTVLEAGDVKAGKGKANKGAVNSISLHGESNEETNSHMNNMVNCIKQAEKLPPDGKAALLISAYKLAGKPMITQPEVKVTITYRSKSIREAVEEAVPDANYEHAYELYSKHADKLNLQISKEK